MRKKKSYLDAPEPAESLTEEELLDANIAGKQKLIGQIKRDTVKRVRAIRGSIRI